MAAHYKWQLRDGILTGMMVSEQVASWLESAVQAAWSVAADIRVTPAETQFGDFQSNIAMQLAKELGENPREIAEPVVEQLSGLNDVERAEVAGPGFINITLTEDFWRQCLRSIGQGFGRSEMGQGQKVQVEYISANPTGPLTLGNARGGFIGDVLSNVLESQGYVVTREYYFNDAGTQIQKLAESYQDYVAGTVSEETTYKGEYMVELAADAELREYAEKATLDDPEIHNIITDKEEFIVDDNDNKLIADFGVPLAGYVMQHYIEPALEKANISFDVYQKERDIVRVFGQVREVLQQQDLIEERDGALWLTSSDLGDERDRVLIKSSGEHTYLANDIAYHYDIFARREFDQAIKIWGADHAGQVPSLRLIVHQLFPDKDLDFLIVQWVRLIKDGQEFKISKRAGTYVTVDELVERVGADVARWFMLARSNDTHMDFDLDLAAEQSQKNPFWYVMYASVRARAIVREAHERGVTTAEQPGELEGVEREIVKHLSQWPELLEDVARSFEVHRLTFYGYELARLFHEWYEQVRVVDLPTEEASQKLYFLQQLQIVMNELWAILGIEPYERM